MADRLVTIATFDLPAKARLAQNILTEAGIKSVVADEAVVTMDWLLGNAVGWVKVQVMEEDAERAVAVLEEALGSDEPVDEDSLAAEAEAASSEEGTGPPESTPTSPTPEAQPDTPQASAASEPAADEFEPPPIGRDEYARRLLYGAIFSLVFAPLWFYALYLLLNAAFGPGPLSALGQRRLLIGGTFMAIGAVLPLFFCSAFGGAFR
jgi:hypothetical protein